MYCPITTTAEVLAKTARPPGRASRCRPRLSGIGEQESDNYLCVRNSTWDNAPPDQDLRGGRDEKSARLPTWRRPGQTSDGVLRKTNAPRRMGGTPAFPERWETSADSKRRRASPPLEFGWRLCRASRRPRRAMRNQTGLEEPWAPSHIRLAAYGRDSERPHRATQGLPVVAGSIFCRPAATRRPGDVTAGVTQWPCVPASRGALST